MGGKTKYFLIGLTILLLILSIWFLGKIIAYVLIAAALSILLQPAVRLLNKIRYKKIVIPGFISALLTLSVFWAIVFLFFRYTFPLIAGEAKILSSIEPSEIVNNIEQPVTHLTEYLSKLQIHLPAGGDLSDIIAKKIMGVVNLTDIQSVLTSVASTVGDIIIAFFAITFITFFFLKDEKMFLKVLLTLTPVEYETEVKHALLSVNRLLMKYFAGVILDVLVVFTLTTTGMTILGIGFQHALILGLAGGLLNVIPYVGPFLSVTFGMFVGIVTNADVDFYTGIMPLLGWMLLVYIIINIIDATLVQPFIFSKSVKAHPLEIFIVILSAGTLAGVTGMILAIPSYTVLRVIAKEFFHNFKFVKKLTKNF